MRPVNLETFTNIAAARRDATLRVDHATGNIRVNDHENVFQRAVTWVRDRVSPVDPVTRNAEITAAYHRFFSAVASDLRYQDQRDWLEDQLGWGLVNHTPKPLHTREIRQIMSKLEQRVSDSADARLVANYVSGQGGSTFLQRALEEQLAGRADLPEGFALKEEEYQQLSQDIRAAVMKELQTQDRVELPRYQARGEEIAKQRIEEALLAHENRFRATAAAAAAATDLSPALPDSDAAGTEAAATGARDRPEPFARRGNILYKSVKTVKKLWPDKLARPKRAEPTDTSTAAAAAEQPAPQTPPTPMAGRSAEVVDQAGVAAPGPDFRIATERHAPQAPPLPVAGQDADMVDQADAVMPDPDFRIVTRPPASQTPPPVAGPDADVTDEARLPSKANLSPTGPDDLAEPLHVATEPERQAPLQETGRGYREAAVDVPDDYETGGPVTPPAGAAGKLKRGASIRKTLKKRLQPRPQEPVSSAGKRLLSDLKATEVRPEAKKKVESLIRDGRVRDHADLVRTTNKATFDWACEHRMERWHKEALKEQGIPVNKQAGAPAELVTAVEKHIMDTGNMLGYERFKAEARLAIGQYLLFGRKD